MTPKTISKLTDPLTFSICIVNKNECEIHSKVIVSQDYFLWYRERLKERICRELFERLQRVFLRDYREFLRDYREYFEEVKRDYKERVKNLQGYLDFE